MFSCVWALLVIFISHYSVDTVVRKDEGSRYSRCSQDKLTDIKCEPIEPQEEHVSTKSMWPPGPYAIPMTIDGCPETSLQGWEKGYLSIIWTNPQTVFTKYQTENESISDNEYQDVLQTKWPGFQTYVFGPFRSFEFKLNFCYKMRRHDSLDTGVWPNGDYSVYGADETCPNGFQRQSHVTNLPNISQWFYDGHVPDFNFQEKTENVFQMWVCQRTNEKTAMSNERPNRILNEAPFMFLQNVDEDCFVFDNYSVQSERLYIGEHQENGFINAQFFQTFCFYQPEVTHELNETDTEDYLVANAITIGGNVTLRSEEAGSGQLSNNLNNQDIFRTLRKDLSDVAALTWRLIDLGRTISISVINIHFKEGVMFPNSDKDIILHLEFRQKIGCFLSDIKWSFQNFGAFHCPYALQYQASSQILYVSFVRTKQGRFIAFLSDVDEMNLLDMSLSFDVFTRLETKGQENCNIDLGMKDHGIQDFQITASSFHPLYPPKGVRLLSSGWCANSGDTQPYIMIDLLYIVNVEGLTISNWEERVNVQDRSNVYMFGSKSMIIMYSTIKGDLQYYYEKAFNIDMTRPISEWQTFWFYKPFDARYVKVQIIDALTEGFNCLRVELHGCRKSGVPSLNCQQGGEFADNIQPFPVSAAQDSTAKGVSSFEDCKMMCQQENQCSSVTYVNDSICSFYKQDNTGNWQFLQMAVKTETSTKLCWDSSVENVPTLLTVEGSLSTVISVVTLLHTETLSTSAGYPFSYPGGQDYRWIVSFEEGNYVKIIFTNVTLSEYEEGNQCNDSILISDTLYTYDNSPRVIDNRFNGQMFIIETSLTGLVMTFTTCLPIARKISDGHGFRTIFTSQTTPACFSLSSDLKWEEGRSEQCLHDSMTLSTMSTLGIPFDNTLEKWELNFPRYRIQLHFQQFQVKCKLANIGSEFKINDRGKERTYCTLNMPPTIMDLLSDNVIVSFYKAKSPGHFLYTDGFVIKYTLTYDITDQVYSLLEPRSKVWNIALGKPANIYYRKGTTQAYKVDATDGVVQMDSRSGSCITSNIYEPWWIVDLQNIYSLDWLMLYNRMDCCFYRLANVEISAGLTVEDMPLISYICDETGESITHVDMKNVSARYAKVQLRYKREYFHLCEVKIYGRLENELGGIPMTFDALEPVNGNWGSWGPWSEICFCNSSQLRKRFCDNPNPMYGGQFCKGSDTSYRHCLPRSRCELQNVAFNTTAYTSSMFSNHKAEYGVDGLPTTCFHTQRDFQPWWMVKLDNIYILHNLVVTNMQPNDLDVYNLVTTLRAIRNIEITAGISACNMRQIDFKCGEKLANSKEYYMFGTTARYIKLQLMSIKEYFHLCEVEIYGQPAAKNMIDRVEDDCGLDTIADGGFSQWSAWTECSAKCGHGKHVRTRSCTNPAPSNGGKACYGKYMDINTCYGTCSFCSETFGKCYSLFPELTNWRHAGVECWHRGMKLVSIRSKAELRFIKYLLRENRYKDGQSIINLQFKTLEMFSANESYYAHIGLLRENKDGDANVRDIWDDSTPVTFSAWDVGQPTEGYCTRMNYRLLTYDNTWETEDCETQLAEYFVCEKQINAETAPLNNADPYIPQKQDWAMIITDRILSTEYAGKLNITPSGTPCLPWAVAIDQHTDVLVEDIMFPEQSRYEAENYCRDPTNQRYVWCFTGSSDYANEECDVELRPFNISTEYSRLKYMGKANKTYSGKTCQHWASKTPHSQYTRTWVFPGETIISVQNYCRDPWNAGFLWCYTVDPNTRWEPCVIPDDLNEMCSLSYRIYRGPLNSTFTGKQCQKWNPSLHQQNGLSDRLNKDLVENTCRDPYNDGFLWCYINEEDWEPCMTYDIAGDHSRETGKYALKNMTFSCKHGQHIPTVMKCDGKFDCRDFSDETDCTGLFDQHILTANFKSSTNIQEDFESGSFFHCNTLEWVSITVRCDGVIDCLDASDETSCIDLSIEKSTCLPDQFECNDGDCIHISQACNFIRDCIDNSDEACIFSPCEKKSEYECDNQQCIPIQQRCNSEPDCSDGSDERSCDECQPNRAFHCDIDRCIPMRLVCDKYKDCEDGTDEMNCNVEKLFSCVDLWEAGSQETGIYSNVLPFTDVLCNFDSIYSQGKIYTTLLNSDSVYSDDKSVYYLISRQYFGIYDDLPWLLSTRDDMTCTQEVQQTCIATHQAASNADDTNHNRNYKHCKCIILKVNIRDENENVYPCDQSSAVSHPEDSFNSSNLVYIYDQEYEYRFIALKDLRSAYHQITTGPLICEQVHMPQTDIFNCEGEELTIPDYLRCIYDVDKTGNTIGCKLGSHLDNCRTFECPENFVKCPDSYCIPIKFVCDGKMQCPDGKDEDRCGCVESKGETIILYDADGDSVDIEGFSRQLFAKDGTVRLLSYTRETPLKENFALEHSVLNIMELKSMPFSSVNRLPICRYKLMARSFLQEIAFSKNSTSKNGIIFVQNGDVAKDIAKEMFENIKENLKDSIVVYRVLEDYQTKFNEPNEYKHVIDVRIRRWKMFEAIGASFFAELCTLSAKIRCPNAYKCAWSKTCIPLHQVCDGFKQCIHGDDENLCKFRCHNKCKCSGYAVFCSNKSIQAEQISAISGNSRLLDLSHNPHLSSSLNLRTLIFPFLIKLNLSMCDIESVTSDGIRGIVNLRSLDLSNNRIKILAAKVFSQLVYLLELNIQGNGELTIIEPGAFEGLLLVRDLRLAGAQLKKIYANTFSGLRLTSIDLSRNKIEEIEPFAFSDLIVEEINFESNEILNFNKEIFTGVIGLKELFTPAFKFCCIRPNYLEEEQCFPKKDEFSSCEDLMRLSALQTILWLVGLAAIIGNALSILYRLVYDRERLKIGFGIFVTNLAVADFLMGIYLMMIAIADAVFRKRYIFFDDYWRNSSWCNLAGFLSTVSSEASVMFLCLITFDRLLVIKFPFGQVRLDQKKASILVGASWIIAITLAAVPLIFVDYFQNKFYTKSGVCIALPLTRDRPPGWMYSVAIFVGLNFLTFVLVAFGQIAIFLEIRKTSTAAGYKDKARKRDLKIARNLLLVVATDFLCWFPIGVMGLLALSGRVISGDVYAWAAVFILPVNSALNPILYTVSAIIGRKTFNPGTDEQNRTEITSTDYGQRILDFLRISPSFVAVRRDSNKALGDVLAKSKGVSARATLDIALQLANILNVLHSNSLVLRNLSVNTILIRIAKKSTLAGKIKLKEKPTLADMPEDRCTDMEQYGRVVRAFLASRQKNNMT